MFAFALWDRAIRRLYLVRDRMGEKPLYYGYVGGRLGFGSELKALARLPGFSNEVDRSALAALMRYSYVPSPRSIYCGLAKLPPGSWVEISSTIFTRRDLPSPRTYWSPLQHAMAGVSRPLRFGSEDEAADALDGLIRRAVSNQMVADVPLGAFLSGGVDSSTVVALMQTQSHRPIRTFSIGFNESGYDEAHHAKEVAGHLGTDHTELYVTASDALGTIPKMAVIYDEPFSDCSQIPTYLVAQLARRHVTVSLSGDGGDELFGGYTRYFLAARTWRFLSRTPKTLRTLATRAIRRASPMTLDRLYAVVAPLVPKTYRLATPGHTLHKAAGLLGSKDGIALYRGLVSHWDPSEVIYGAADTDIQFDEEPVSLPTLTEVMMIIDATTYLPDDILVKVDRAAMAVSLETRVPLLDHRVFEFAWRLPLEYKVRGGVGKRLLRKVLYRYVPRQLIDRPKMGFGVPIDTWLRGPLRSWAEELLSESRLQQEGFFNPAAVRRKWVEHLSGRRNWQYQLWNVLMFQAWLEEHVNRRQPTMH